MPTPSTELQQEVQLRPPPPIPSPLHGRLPTSSSARRTLAASSSLAPFPSSASADPSAQFADAPSPPSPAAVALATVSRSRSPSPNPDPSSSSSATHPPLTEDDWFRFPAPTRAHARSGAPLVDARENKKVKEGKKAKGGKGGGGLRKKEWKMLGEWRVGESLGKGTSGHVRLGRSVKTGEFAAIKKVLRLSAEDKVRPRLVFSPASQRLTARVDGTGLGVQHAASVHREISLMKLVAPHPHVVELLDVFETPTHLYLVTEFCPEGELFNLIVKRALSHVEIHKFYSQLISALQHLSRSSISHRDVKFENLLLYLDERGETCLKLSDMGMATLQPEGALLRTSCGSPHYAAPEVIRATPYDGALADVWSSGIVLYTMFARRLPFDDEHIPTLLDMIKNREYEMHASIMGAARDLVGRCLVKDAGKRIKLDEIASHPFLAPIPYAPEPLSLEAIYPPQPQPAEVDLLLLKDNDLDDAVLESLTVVLKVTWVEEAKRMVSRNEGRARLFYSILRAFREPRLPRSSAPRQYARSIHLDNESLPASVQPSMASIRRSMSAPDMGAFPAPPEEAEDEVAEPVAPPPTALFSPSIDSTTTNADADANPAAPGAPWSARSSVDSGVGPDGRSVVATQRYSLINRQYAFPVPTPTTAVPPGSPTVVAPSPAPSSAPPVVTSAPPHIESFAIRPLPVSPIDPMFFPSAAHGTRPSGSKRLRSRPGTAATTATQSLPVSPLLKADPAFASAAAQAHAQVRPRPSIDVGEIARRLSTLTSAGATPAGAMLQRGPSKKASMQQRLKSLFYAQGGKRASVASVPEDSSSLAAVKVETEKVKPSSHPPPSLPPPTCPLPPPPPPPTASSGQTIPTIRPPSPAPSAASSMLKRSSAYRSFGRALNGKPPHSPELAEFGELLAMGASASQEARASHVQPPPVQREAALRRKKSSTMGGLLKLSSSPSRASLAPPGGGGIQFYRDSETGKAKPTVTPTPASSPSKRKGRPLPLTIDSTNSVRTASTPSATTPGTAKSLFKPPSLLGLGRPPRRPLLSPQQPPACQLSPVPSVVVDQPAAERDENDPEDPFSLLSALKQYPYRSASCGSTTARSRTSVSSSVGPFSTAGSTFRNVSGSTNATTLLSARSPRIGEDDYAFTEHDLSFASDGSIVPADGYSSSYAASMRRERDLASRLLHVELENKLLHAAVEARDDELERLRRQERRLTSCVESGEQVVRELSAEREELEELVRALDWEKQRSFLSLSASGTAEGEGEVDEEEEEEDEDEDEAAKRARLSRKVREDEWLQSLRGRA
ncbi:hypothetical protein JCM6882_002372 [Rhodosporidiobolus microsporus]